MKKYIMSESEKKEVNRVAQIRQKAGKPVHIGFVYFIRAENGFFKIGRTVNLQKRFKVLKNMSPLRLELFHYFPTANCVFAEKIIHEAWEEYRVRGEWFDLPNDEINYIKSAKVCSL